MGQHENDADLRGLFKEMRLRDEQASPRFDSVLRNAGIGRKSRSSWLAAGRLIPAVAASAIAVTFALFMVYGGNGVGRKTSRRLPSSIVTWRASTDFLLNSPTRELTNELPQVGGNLPRLVRPSNNLKLFPERRILS